MLSGGETSREAALALPLSRLVAKMVRIPSANRDDPVAFAAPVLQALSPYPDEPLTVSCEAAGETADGCTAIAAALPESSADDIASALDAAKLNVTRIDALAFGILRRLWKDIGAGRAGRRLLAVGETDDVALIVLDEDRPVALRAVAPGAGIAREATLLLLEAESFGGAKKLEETVAVGDVDAEAFGRFGPVRKVEISGDFVETALAGVAERTADPAALDALPDSWRQVLEDERFKAKAVKHLAIAGGIWLLAMAVLFGVPVAYGFMTDRQKRLSKEHSARYREVSAMQTKVELVRKYSNHDLGALETMKFVSDRLPIAGEDVESIKLDTWRFERGKEISVRGSAETAQLVYDFKNALEGTAKDPGIFAKVELAGPQESRGRQTFTIKCLFEADEEE